VPEISFRHVSKTFDPGVFKKKVQAVKDLSLDVAQGEVFGLIGPNGAGKSTTIRLLLGLIRSDRGEILFRDKPLREAKIQSQIGYLPENPYLYEHLTLRELLEFCGKVSGLTAEYRRRRIDDLLAQVGMSGAQNRPVRTFSKGMLQRGGICFALLHDPSVVILDEPMSGLDPRGRKLVFDIVMDLKRQGKTVFFCSHILSDVERLCDRIGILVSGRLARELRREEFQKNVERPLHLVLPSLSGEQKRVLGGFGGELRPEPNGQLLSIEPDRLEDVARTLREWGVEVRASRSECVSLEEIFLQVVEEHTT